MLRAICRFGKNRESALTGPHPQHLKRADSSLTAASITSYIQCRKAGRIRNRTVNIEVESCAEY
jgi:hypothetical protein